ncbi:sodium:calcium antiporter [Haladaptatus sp. GCM10025707]|uniref:sodium:calcium antiporter n=1 Tax=unclassified Haladaptatus TaxID=2622732 RepID=UPI0023E80878|nr:MULTISPECIES: sodium:calcium antiporter [unclassified Haladaptatus]
MALHPAIVSLPISSRALENGILLLGSFLLLLLGAEVFTNGVEWLGHRLGVSESATGSILAAVGTALPETMIPLIAIVHGLATGDTSGADEVGVGAILGAPFMLATIAMFLIGVSVLYFSRRRSYGPEFHFNEVSTRRDLSFFLVGYTLAFTAALVRWRPIQLAIAASLLVLYGVYVYRSLKSGELIEGGDLDDLHLGLFIERGWGPIPGIGDAAKNYSDDPSKKLVLVQTFLALVFIVAGAQLFVTEVEFFSEEVLTIPAAVVALLLAPLATELPEKFNSIIWISQDKDTLAIGNITGAMAFQGTLPVTLGIVFTSWNLSLEWGSAGFLNAFSAVLAILSGVLLYLRARTVNEGNMKPLPFLIGGAFYLLFIVVLVYHVLFLGLSVTGGN